MGKIKLKKIENCIELEKALGLKRGDVVSITTEPDGSVEVEFADTVKLPDSTLEGKLEKLFGMKIKKE